MTSLTVIVYLQTVFFFNLIKYPEKGITYETTYRYPVWAEVLGWCIAALPMVCIPAYAMLKILQTSGTIKEVPILNCISMNILLF